MSQSRIILYYSKQCKHSRNILNTLSQNSQMLSKFDLVDIAVHKPPNYIKAVPSVLIPKANNEADMLVGKAVFEWIKSILSSQSQQNQPHPSQMQNQAPPQAPSQAPSQQSPQQEGISDFDPCTMNGFSDNFSFLGSDNKSAPMDHNFAFLSGNGDKLINPNQFQSSGNGKEADKVKSEMEQRLQQLQSNRDSEVPQAIQRS